MSLRDYLAPVALTFDKLQLLLAVCRLNAMIAGRLR